MLIQTTSDKAAGKAARLKFIPSVAFQLLAQLFDDKAVAKA